MAGHSFGTDIRRGFNARMMGQALKQHGMDTRYWVSEGTVGTTDPETGEFNPRDNRAVFNDSSGCFVDVQLQPLGIPCVCQYSGIQAGEVTIYAPIRPGDRVKISLPDGDLTNPVIDAILNSRSNRQPVDGGRPIFDNNRLLIHAKSVPIDIRTAGGAHVFLKQDGSVHLGNKDSTESLVLGDKRNTSENQELAAISESLSTLIAAASDGPCAPLVPGFTAMKAAVEAFKLQLDGFLSPKVKTS